MANGLHSWNQQEYILKNKQNKNKTKIDVKKRAYEHTHVHVSITKSFYKMYIFWTTDTQSYNKICTNNQTWLLNH